MSGFTSDLYNLDSSPYSSYLDTTIHGTDTNQAVLTALQSSNDIDTFNLDFDSLIQDIKAASLFISYKDQSLFLRNVGYLLESNAPSLTGEADLLVGTPLQKALIDFWHTNPSNEQLINDLFAKLKNMLQ